MLYLKRAVLKNHSSLWYHSLNAQGAVIEGNGIRGNWLHVEMSLCHMSQSLESFLSVHCLLRLLLFTQKLEWFTEYLGL